MNSSSGGAGMGVGAEPGHRDVRGHGVAAQQLCPGPLLAAELAQPQLAAILQAHEHARGPVAQRCACVEQLKAPRRHQVDQQRQLARLDGEHLPDPPHAVQLPPRERVERRVERLEGHQPGRKRRLHGRAREPRRQAACGDLDLGQLGHASRLG